MHPKTVIAAAALCLVAAMAACGGLQDEPDAQGAGEATGDPAAQSVCDRAGDRIADCLFKTAPLTSIDCDTAEAERSAEFLAMSCEEIQDTYARSDGREGTGTSAPIGEQGCGAQSKDSCCQTICARAEVEVVFLGIPFEACLYSAIFKGAPSDHCQCKYSVFHCAPPPDANPWPPAER